LPDRRPAWHTKHFSGTQRVGHTQNVPKAISLLEETVTSAWIISLAAVREQRAPVDILCRRMTSKQWARQDRAN